MTSGVIATIPRMTPRALLGFPYDREMPRWEAGAQARLTQAAYELYVERGFDGVTVAEIAERAGLTKRTFLSVLR